MFSRSLPRWCPYFVTFRGDTTWNARMETRAFIRIQRTIRLQRIRAVRSQIWWIFALTVCNCALYKAKRVKSAFYENWVFIHILLFADIFRFPDNFTGQNIIDILYDSYLFRINRNDMPDLSAIRGDVTAIFFISRKWQGDTDVVIKWQSSSTCGLLLWTYANSTTIYAYAYLLKMQAHTEHRIPLCLFINRDVEKARQQTKKATNQ